MIDDYLSFEFLKFINTDSTFEKSPHEVTDSDVGRIVNFILIGNWHQVSKCAHTLYVVQAYQEKLKTFLVE